MTHLESSVSGAKIRSITLESLLMTLEASFMLIYGVNRQHLQWSSNDNHNLFIVQAKRLVPKIIKSYQKWINALRCVYMCNLTVQFCIAFLKFMLPKSASECELRAWCHFDGQGKQKRNAKSDCKIRHVNRPYQFWNTCVFIHSFIIKKNSNNFQKKISCFCNPMIFQILFFNKSNTKQRGFFTQQIAWLSLEING